MGARVTVHRTVDAALRAVPGDHSWSADYYRKRARVHLTGGPEAAYVEAALQPLLEDGTLKHVEVHRSPVYTCGTVHSTPVHAWAAHEGAKHLSRIEADDCELGCDHGEDAITLDALAELVAAGVTFTSTTCTQIPPTPVPAATS